MDTDSPVAEPIASAVVEEAVRAEQPVVVVQRQSRPDVQEQVRRSAARPRPIHEALLDDAQDAELDGYDEDGLPVVDFEALRARDVARELLRARLVAIAERRERRSAWEIAFILLAASVALLLSAPLLVQVFLAMHGVEA